MVTGLASGGKIIDWHQFGWYQQEGNHKIHRGQFPKVIICILRGLDFIVLSWIWISGLGIRSFRSRRGHFLVAIIGCFISIYYSFLFPEKYPKWPSHSGWEMYTFTQLQCIPTPPACPGHADQSKNGHLIQVRPIKHLEIQYLDIFQLGKSEYSLSI